MLQGTDYAQSQLLRPQNLLLSFKLTNLVQLLAEEVPNKLWSRCLGLCQMVIPNRSYVPNTLIAAKHPERLMHLGRKSLQYCKYLTNMAPIWLAGERAADPNMLLAPSAVGFQSSLKFATC